MATAREIRRRIQSVKNISQVTHALEAVSASKARRAQAAVMATRPYAQSAWKVLVHLSRQVGADSKLHPLFDWRSIGTIGVVLITGDRGLAGAFNYNLVRAAMEFIDHHPAKPQARLITVGKKGRELMLRRGYHIVHEFTGMPAAPTLADVTPIARAVMDGFVNVEYDAVYLVYADFINTLVQKPVVKRLLPIRTHGTQDQVAAEHALPEGDQEIVPTDYIYEPSPRAVLDAVVPRFTELQVYQAVLESLASEHSARMVAMRNATDSAHDLIGALTLRYNKARQQGITSELLDIAGGAEALNQAMAAAGER